MTSNASILTESQRYLMDSNAQIKGRLRFQQKRDWMEVEVIQRPPAEVMGEAIRMAFETIASNCSAIASKCWAATNNCVFNVKQCGSIASEYLSMLKQCGSTANSFSSMASECWSLVNTYGSTANTCGFNASTCASIVKRSGIASNLCSLVANSCVSATDACGSIFNECGFIANKCASMVKKCGSIASNYFSIFKRYGSIASNYSNFLFFVNNRCSSSDLSKRSKESEDLTKKVKSELDVKEDHKRSFEYVCLCIGSVVLIGIALLNVAMACSHLIKKKNTGTTSKKGESAIPLTSTITPEPKFSKNLNHKATQTSLHFRTGTSILTEHA